MRRIVIVDDAQDISRLLKNALITQGQNYWVLTTPSAEEALLEITREKTDLLVTDIRLPGISGVELAFKVRARSPETRLILMTGLSDENLPPNLSELHADAFFDKPLDVAEFIGAVRRIFGESTTTPGTMIGPVQPVLRELPPAPALLPDLLVGLRQRLNAISVLLLDSLGRTVAQAGSFPSAEFDDAWVPALSHALSAGADAGRLASGETPPEYAYVTRGNQFDLVAASAGFHALVVVLPKGPSALRMAIALEEVLAARVELVGLFPPEPVVMAAPAAHETQAPPEAAGAAPDESQKSLPANELASLLASAEPASLDQASRFWEESLAEPPAVEPVEPDILTYDQARQLGLAPDSDQADEES